MIFVTKRELREIWETVTLGAKTLEYLAQAMKGAFVERDKILRELSKKNNELEARIESLELTEAEIEHHEIDREVN